MPRGGARPGAGRRKGSVAKHNKLAREATAEAVEKAGQTPLDFLLTYMRDDTKSDKDRLAAATAAAGYVHHKLSAVDHSGSLGISHEDALNQLEEAEHMNGANEHAH